MTRKSLAREVLSQDELAEYEAEQRMEARPMHVASRPTPHLADETGYTRDGTYYVERDMD